MTNIEKQREEIRTEMAITLMVQDFQITILKARKVFKKATQEERDYYLSRVDSLLQCLDAHGVVMVVERELPENWWSKNCRQQREKPAKICQVCPFIDCETGNLKGYKPVASLIEGEE
jgi:hypothetical protein